MANSQGKIIRNRVKLHGREILQAVICILVISICLKSQICVFQFALPAVLNLGFAVEPSKHII